LVPTHPPVNIIGGNGLVPTEATHHLARPLWGRMQLFVSWVLPAPVRYPIDPVMGTPSGIVVI